MSIQKRALATKKTAKAKPTTTPATPPVAPAVTALTPAAIQSAVTDALPQLSSIEAGLGPAPTVTSEDKRRATKMRKGGEAIAAVLGTLAKQHQIETPSLQVQPMTDALATADALKPLQTAAAAFVQRVENRVFEAESSAWTTALAIYAILRRMSDTDAALATAIKPVVEFMAFRASTPKQAGEPTKPQKRALKKSVATVKKIAPQLLADDSNAPVPAAPAAPTGNGATPTRGS